MAQLAIFEDGGPLQILVGIDIEGYGEDERTLALQNPETLTKCRSVIENMFEHIET